MKKWKKMLALFLSISALTACTVQQNAVSESEPVPEQKGPAIPDGEDRTGMPTIPEGIPEDMEYLFDFTFAERYDEAVDMDFSLDFSGAEGMDADTLVLFEQYRDETGSAEVYDYSGDGMTPYSVRRYVYPDGVIVGTHCYEADGVEYISYLWTNREGVRTAAGIGVGSTQEEIMAAYPSALYYIPGNQTEEDTIAFSELTAFELEFDHAVTWQPFTIESNELRDITFYIQDEIVTSMEVTQPFELRYVYGFDGGPELVTAPNE